MVNEDNNHCDIIMEETPNPLSNLLKIFISHFPFPSCLIQSCHKKPSCNPLVVFNSVLEKVFLDCYEQRQKLNGFSHILVKRWLKETKKKASYCSWIVMNNLSSFLVCQVLPKSIRCKDNKLIIRS